MSSALRIGVVVLLGLLVIGISTGGAQSPAKVEGPKVVAHATATAIIKPDLARLTFAITSSVEGEDKSAHAANELQSKTIQEALQTQAKVKVEVETTPAAASTLVAARANPGTAPTIVAKKAQTVFRVTVREGDYDKLKEAVGRLSDAILSHGGTTIVSEDSSRSYRFPKRLGGGEEEPDAVQGPAIEWLASDTSTARRDAIRRAVKDAKADAEAAAGTDKLKISEISVWGGDYTPNQAGPYSYYTGESRAPAATGMVQFKVFVNITCTY